MLRKKERDRKREREERMKDRGEKYRDRGETERERERQTGEKNRGEREKGEKERQRGEREKERKKERERDERKKERDRRERRKIERQRETGERERNREDRRERKREREERKIERQRETGERERDKGEKERERETGEKERKTKERKREGERETRKRERKKERDRGEKETEERETEVRKRDRGEKESQKGERETDERKRERQRRKRKKQEKERGRERAKQERKRKGEESVKEREKKLSEGRERKKETEDRVESQGGDREKSESKRGEKGKEIKKERKKRENMSRVPVPVTLGLRRGSTLDTLFMAVVHKVGPEDQSRPARGPIWPAKGCSGLVDNDHSAVYVNVAQVRKSLCDSLPSAPSSYSPSYLDSEGWEVHFDQDSGQDYYYHPASGHTTWNNPFTDSSPSELKPCTYSPSPPQSPPLSPATPSSDWEELVDERSGRTYFYNPMSGETSWDPPVMEPMSVHRFHEDGPPPLPEEDYPQEDYPQEDYPAVDPPEQYEDHVGAGGVSPTQDFNLTHATRTVIPRPSLTTPTGWNLTVEPNGTWVFTNENTPEQWIKSWTLPEAPHPPGHSRVENGGLEVENANVLKNWRHSMGPATLSPAQDDGRFAPTHKRATSDYSSDSSSTGNSPEIQHNVQNLEKAGILNKTKICENGKKVRKNWAQTWTVLQHGVLTFHKDPKSAATGASNKTNQIVPEIQVDLRGATLNWASKEKSSKKNVLELKNTIRQLEYQEHQSEEDDNENVYEKIPNSPNIERDDKKALEEKRRTSRASVTHTSSNAADADQKRVKTKLMKFLLKRPTLQSVKEKGYIRDNVFGCHLATLCGLERSSVPSFVEKCIKAVEKRGLDIDGLYRVSGNLAVIQKLRFKADHEELDLEDGQWEDVHVITGALKLFFRELPEPLFPFSHFNKFIDAIRQPDYNSKLTYVCNLVKSLPQPNHDTMKLLFEHLRNVIDYGEDNRMTVQNVAIVFGPTLLRPENESNNLTMHMVFQNQIVEFILNEYERIFL
ncbi:hypothetical protein WMY93_010556 [Mugilogobius chulae]|uniref:Rho GTPase-activating protein 27 n=1 Tax=Mugilogobius chulae TaxID=88201 RepID=A0AAW0PBB5_9GOBI